MSFPRDTLPAILLIAAGACAAPRAIVSHLSEPVEALLELESLGDERVLVRFPDGGVLAHGRIRRGIPSGEWHYWYPDGSLMRVGTLAPSMEGLWLHFTRGGKVVLERQRLQCDGFVLSSSSPRDPMRELLTADQHAWMCDYGLIYMDACRDTSGSYSRGAFMGPAEDLPYLELHARARTLLAEIQARHPLSAR